MYSPSSSALGLAAVVPVTGPPLFSPKLTVTGSQFSEMILPTLERKSTTTVMVAVLRCVRLYRLR